MRSGKVKLVVLVVFALALVGGAGAGMLAERYVAPPAAVATDRSLTEELQLTDAQRDQIRLIWEHMGQVADESYHQAEWINQQRDQELMKILSPAQQKQYEKIHQDYVDRYSAVSSRRQAAFKEAVAKTKELLNDSQRKRYDAILADRLGRGTGEGDGMSLPRTAPTAPSLTSSSASQPIASPG